MIVQEEVSHEVALRLVELSPGVCCVFGHDGLVEYANPEAQRILRHQILGPRRSFLELIHPGDLVMFEKALQDCSRAAKCEVEARMQIANGQYRCFQWSLAPAGSRIIGVAREKTDLCGDLPSYTRDEHEESIGVLAGGIAHDFNNLLTGIIGSASLAAQDLPCSDPARRLMEDVITLGQRAADLTQQLLAYAGKGGFEATAVDLSDAAAEMVQGLLGSIPATVKLEVELAERIPPIQADARQVQQIVLNLLMNAAEAVNEYGVIRVSTGRMQVGTQPSCGAGACQLSPGEYVFLQVEDTGPGMDEHVKARIFDPFFTTKFVGRGLGLAAVSGFVRAHKGAIQLTTAPGQGSTFRVLLPVMQRTTGVRAKRPVTVDAREKSAGERWERRAQR